MESIFFSKESLNQRILLKEKTEESVLRENTSDGLLQDLPYQNEVSSWLGDKDLLSNPRIYNVIHKNIVAKIAGQFTSANYITTVQNSLDNYLDKELVAIERELQRLEGLSKVLENYQREKSLISNVWSLKWTDEDITYQPTEKNLLNNSQPYGTTIVGDSLTLGRVQDFSIYGNISPGILNISDYAGGDLNTKFTKSLYETFEKFGASISTSVLSEKRFDLIPWISDTSKKAYVKLRISFNSPKVFSDVFIKGGTVSPITIDSIYWASIGNEFTNSLCPTGMSQWTVSGGIISSQSKIPFQLPVQTFAILNPGTSFVPVTGTYLGNSEVKTSFPISDKKLACRLNVLWRGLGDLHLSTNTKIVVSYTNVSGTVVYSQVFDLVEGLDSPTNTVRDIFSWSRFIVYQPANCVSGSIKIFTSLSDVYDPNLVSQVEIAGVGVDTFAGKSSNSKIYLSNVTYDELGSSIHIDEKPEAQFIEIVLSQDTYTRDFIDSVFQYIFSFDIDSLDIRIVDDITSSRWVSKIQHFSGDPRKFVLRTTVPDNVSIRLSYKDNLPTVELTQNKSIVLVNNSTEVVSSLDTDYIYLPVEDVLEEFSSTDLSGRLNLSSVPYIDTNTIESIDSILLQQNSDYVYDPNVILASVSKL